MPQYSPRRPVEDFALLGPFRTLDEARVDHAASANWQERGPMFGRVLGVLGGLAVGALTVRTLRSALGGKQ